MAKIKEIISKEELKKYVEFKRLPLLLSLTRRAVFFFFFVLISQVFLFFTGSVQSFLDENLLLILTISGCSGAGMMFFSLAAAVECIYYLISKRRILFAGYFAFFVLCFFIGLVFCIGISTVNALATGGR